MTSFIHVERPTQHDGVARAERAIESFKQAIRNFEGARGAATLVLAAVVSALLVVANQVAQTWTEGHLLGAWIAMWAVGFAALALLAAPLRRTGVRIRSQVLQWAAARRQARADANLWQLALTDARVMADISRAMNRDVSGARAAG
jgi:hypothetical protein